MNFSNLILETQAILSRLSEDNAEGVSTVSDIIDQLSDDYPSKTLQWIRDAEVTGPERVKLSNIDFANKAKWRAIKEPDRVKKFTKKIKKFWEKPILLVDRPGFDKLMIADGHHRALAYSELGKNPLAFIVKVKTDKGQWDLFHDEQHEED